MDSGAQTSENPYEGLRQLALSIDPSAVGFNPTAELPDVFGVVSDVALQGTATLLCLCDGTTSLYYSSGGGAIGLGQHESIRLAALGMVATVQAHLNEFVPGGDDTPLPADYYRFTALSYSGLLTLTASEANLAATDSGAGRIFRAFHSVVGAYRIWSEAQPDDAR